MTRTVKELDRRVRGRLPRGAGRRAFLLQRTRRTPATVLRECGWRVAEVIETEGGTVLHQRASYPMCGWGAGDA